MSHLLIRQKFTDYTTWRAAFDSLVDARERIGLRTALVALNQQDPDEAFVVFEVGDAELVRDHFVSPALRAAHERGGVIPGSTHATFLVPPTAA
jgi:hypothetical protein